jgi:hypothetical protein
VRPLHLTRSGRTGDQQGTLCCGQRGARRVPQFCQQRALEADCRGDRAGAVAPGSAPKLRNAAARGGGKTLQLRCKRAVYL